jgi:hypothetical protein
MRFWAPSVDKEIASDTLDMGGGHCMVKRTS